LIKKGSRSVPLRLHPNANLGTSPSVRRGLSGSHTIGEICMKRRPGSSGRGAAGQRNLRGTQHTVGAFACSHRVVAPHSPPPGESCSGHRCFRAKVAGWGLRKKAIGRTSSRGKTSTGGSKYYTFPQSTPDWGKKIRTSPGKKNAQTRVRNKNNP